MAELALYRQKQTVMKHYQPQFEHLAAMHIAREE